MDSTFLTGLILINYRFFPTTQQAADILADRLNAKVVMPDFTHGKPFDSERYLHPPPGADIRKEIGDQFFAPKFLDARVAEVKRVAVALRTEGKTSVGVRSRFLSQLSVRHTDSRRFPQAIGLCW